MLSTDEGYELREMYNFVLVTNSLYNHDEDKPVVRIKDNIKVTCYRNHFTIDNYSSKDGNVKMMASFSKSNNIKLAIFKFLINVMYFKMSKNVRDKLFDVVCDENARKVKLY